MEVIKMRTKIFMGLVLLLLGLTFLFAGEVLAAKKPRHRPPPLLPVDEAQAPEAYTGPSPVMYEGGNQPDCEDIHPTIGYDHVIQHDQWASTFYDYQKNGSMGRMIAVSCGGHKHMVCHETRGPYTTFPRYVTYNCKNPVSVWCGPMWVDGGPGIQAGYVQMLLMHHGMEVVLYHRTQPPIGCWYSTLARGESVEDQGTCFIQKKYDIPDKHDFPQVATTPDGMWPKGAMMYDAITDTDYVHIVTTESPPEGEVYQSVAYQRCVFEATDIVCYAPRPTDPAHPYGPYRRAPGVAGNADDSVAVFDYLTTISAVVVSSPVSKRVAIVYTKSRGGTSGGEQQANNDVVYIESMNNGEDWFANWPPTIHNITNYPTEASERAYMDVAACYDYNDSLHIIWNGCYYDSVGGYVTYDANLYHWSKEHEITMIAPGYWEDTEPGAWNRNLCKMSISAQDPIYHPGGDPDSVFLYCTWTQFNPGDMSLGGWSNGDIYAAVSIDGGQCWTPGYNLTNTKAPGCTPGECLSEHWSSLAENMYDGDLHIEYVCDRDPGGIVGNESAWTDNPMMYLHLEWSPSRPCGVSINNLDPPDWCNPPVKVAPGEGRVIAMELSGVYNVLVDYEVTTDNPNVVPTLNGDGYLSPGEQKRVELTIFCPGEESFLDVTVYVHYCIWTEWEDTVEMKLHTVCSDDYYECPVDPRTWIIKDNCKCSLWICANTEERVWDKRVLNPHGSIIQPIFSGGVIVATTWDGDTVVGRQDYRDIRTGARDTINVVQSTIPHPDEEQECMIQMIYVKNTFICANHLEPPNHQKWWWIDIHKKIIMFHDRPGLECPNWKKEQVIKKVWIDYSEPPVWWPDPGEYPGHENICFGYFADVDAPYDTGCIACNKAGYDASRELVWFRGYNAGSHPEYENYYVGLTFTDEDGGIVDPYGVHVVRNDSFLYPQNGWGWKDGQLCSVACIPGVTIQDEPIDTLDRTVVMTAEVLPAGTETDFFSHYILIEAFIPDGLAVLQEHIDDTRAILIPELRDLDIFYQYGAGKVFPICGDVNEDGVVNVGDLVYLATYLFLNGPPPSWPMNRADVNGDGIVNVGDLVYLATYLFGGGPPPDCSGFGRG
jgi:hypothetical protein